jgi:hypothetical protein
MTHTHARAHTYTHTHTTHTHTHIHTHTHTPRTCMEVCMLGKYHWFTRSTSTTHTMGKETNPTDGGNDGWLSRISYLLHNPLHPTRNVSFPHHTPSQTIHTNLDTDNHATIFRPEILNLFCVMEPFDRLRKLTEPFSEKKFIQMH